MKKIVAGNWKMHGDAAMAEEMVEAVTAVAADLPGHVEVILCPPAPLLLLAAAMIEEPNVKVGGQDCHSLPEGAFTGDISAGLLAEAGAEYVIVGHSERRQGHSESSDLVRKKAARAIRTGLIPIICVGETATDRDSRQAEEVVGAQVRDSLPEEAREGNFLIAYEPVWAIGTGRTPTSDDIRKMHAYILSVTTKRSGLAPEQVFVLYGGSVKGDNAGEIMAIEGVSGVLVGGASLKVDEFCRIMQAA